MAFKSNFVWSTNLLKNSLEVIHTFIDYSEWPSKYSPLEDRRIVSECGVLEPQLEISIYLLS